MIDNLERGLAAAGVEPERRGGTQSEHARRRAYFLTYRELCATPSKRAGVEPFDPKGEPFDPNRHEALPEVSPSRAPRPGTVVEVAQKGYSLGEQLIRPARVVVAE